MTITDLITRVEQGSGSDRQLDADICVALQWIGVAYDSAEPVKNVREDEPGWLIFDEGDDTGIVTRTPHLTSSLDAIRALFKARLDGYCAHIYDDGYPHACVFARGYQLTTSGTDIHRAFLSGVLKAIAAKEG